MRGQRSLATIAVVLAGALPGVADDVTRPMAPPANAPGDLTSARPPDRPADLGRDAATPDTPPVQGTLIPPEAPVDTTAAAPRQDGPPAYSLLRESDFDFAACRLELTMLGTVYNELPPVTDPDDRDCGIARPLQIDQILPGVAVQGGAQMRCDTARALAHWMRDVVLPAARFLPGAPQVNAVAPGSTYQCRGVVGGASTARLSEHALGNAFDVAGFGFADAAPIEIAPRDDSGSDMTIAFQRAVRASACLYFTTVLGPGSNAAHDDHLHLDVKQRNGGYRLCQ